MQEGFDNALNAVKSLNVCRASEIRLAVENWVSGDMLTEARADSLCRYYNVGRAP